MKAMFWVLMVFSLLAMHGSVSAESHDGRLGNWSVRTGEGDALQLYDRLKNTSGTLIALGASSSQEAGQAQQAAFMNTHQQLAERGFNLPPIVHFNIIAGAPRLVQGFIRRGIVREYSDPVQAEDIWLMFPDDYSDYQRQTGLTVGDWGHWVWVDDQGHIVWSLEQQGDQTIERLLERLSEQNLAP